MDPLQTPPITPAQTPVVKPAASPLTQAELPVLPEKLLSAPRTNSWGAVIGIAIILIVLVVGALYFWGAKLAEQEGSALITEEEFSAEAEVPALDDTTTDGFEATAEIAE